ncbi:MAG: bile acid:sodium symporter [Cyanobacteria bacterium P01_D01_bin.6]
MMNDSLLVTLLQNKDFNIFVQIVVFLIMFAMGVRLTTAALVEIRTYPGALLRSLIGVVILVPATVFAVAPLFKALGLSIAVGTGLVLLVASPGAPLTTKRTGMASGDFEFSAALQLLCGTSAILVTPGIIWVYAQFFPNTREAVEFLAIAKQVAIVQFLPLGLGLAVRLVWSDLADEIAPRVQQMADVAFLVLVLIAVIVGLPVILATGPLAIAAIAAVAAIALLVGHLLGGPDLSRQSATAVACVARNVGLALFIATLNTKLLVVLPTIVGYMIIGSILAIPYSVWMKKRIAQQAESLADESAIASSTT